MPRIRTIVRPRHRAWLALPPVAALLLGVLACSRDDAPADRQSVATEQALDMSAASPEAPPPPPGRGAVGAAFGTASGAASAPSRARAARREENAAQSPAAGSQAATDTTSVVATSMLIRTGSATIEVDSLEPAIAAVQALAQRAGGYVANTQLQTGEGQIRSATLELRFPSARWADVTGGLRPVGTLEALAENTQDVGEEYVDVTARVANARRLEERLVELLRTRTGKLEDVLAVERELARVREEIERYEGRLRWLRSRVALSTLSVTVHEPRPVFTPRPGPGRIGEAFRDAWRNFVGFLAGLIAALGWIVPLLLVVGLAIWVARRLGVRRWRSDRDARPPTP